MLVIIQSPAGSEKAILAVNTAAETAADIVLMGDAVGLARKEMLEGFCGTAFALADDVSRLLPPGTELESGVKLINADDLTRMLRQQESSGPY